MPKAKLIFKRTYQSTLGLLGIFLIASFSGCFTFRMNPDEAKKYFAKNNCEYEFCNYSIENKKISYVKTGHDDYPLIIFVHGAPGSWDNFKTFLADTNLLKDFKMLSVDRPGYGFSDFGNSMISIEDQAEVLMPLLSENKSTEKPILVGHSYGGPVIAKMAMDHPEKFRAIIMVAPAIDPRREVYYWITKPADNIPLKWIVPKVFKVANDEKINHANELYRIIDGWERITCPVTTLHGKKDKLVPVENCDFAEKKLINCPDHRVVKDNGNHLIPFNRPKMINEAINYYLK